MEYNELSISFFLQRLKQLQNLCSTSNSDFPDALLFVPGLDGRNNKGSSTVLRYLFQGAVSKELNEGFLDGKFEILEDIILLVQESSVSIFWSHKVKELIGNLLVACPVLIEYGPTIEEEDEIDTYQARKCIDFKRMILESIPVGGAIGLPVPLGYEDVLDTESWPLLQAFALDEVYCTTGFFTARYAVVDMTANLDIIFRSVDGHYVDKAIDSMRQSILTHCLQTIGQLETSSVEQRGRLTVDSVLAPLDLLYDFGEMEAPYPVDPSLRPVVLVGSSSTLLGTHTAQYPRDWRDKLIGDNLHVVVEGCEPCGGLRWTRTYFLARGRAVQTVDDVNDLVSEDANTGSAVWGPRDDDRSALVAHMEGLYVKLWLGLRWAAQKAFNTYQDVLEAGTEVQGLMEAVLGGACEETRQLWVAAGLRKLNDVALGPDEKLRVHMDCIDGMGRIVSVDDVQDMGGQCWVYLRVSVHGVQCGDGPGSVAVGDTFLFSPRFSHLISQANGSKETVTMPVPGLLSDKICITHAVPYFRCLLGPGAEARLATRLLSAVRNPHVSGLLGLGTVSDFTNIDDTTVTIPVITDHPLQSFFLADVRIHAGGLIFHRMNRTTTLPVVVSLARHVECMWTVDWDTCLSQSLARGGLTTGLEGLLVLFRLKDDSETNPLALSLPGLTTSSARHVAIFIREGSREAGAMSKALGHWRHTLRAEDIPEHKGGLGERLPTGFLLGVVTALDSMAAEDEDSRGRGKLSAEQVHQLATGTPHEIVGTGYDALRCAFATSETDRLAAVAVSDIDVASPGQRASDVRRAIVLTGHPGSGLLAATQQISSSLQTSLSEVVPVVVLDLALSSLEAAFQQLSRKTLKGPVVLALITDASKLLSTETVLGHIEALIGIQVAATIAVASVAVLDIERAIGAGQGLEVWKASAFEPFQAGLGDLLLVVDTVGAKYVSVKAMLEARNPYVSPIKISPKNIRLDEDVIDMLATRLRGTMLQNHPSAAMLARRGPRRPVSLSLETLSQTSRQSLAGPPGVKTVGLKAFRVTGSGRTWDVAVLTSALKKLFPSATVTSSVVEQSWRVPPAEKDAGVGVLARAVLLAKVKVLSKRRSDQILGRLAAFAEGKSGKWGVLAVTGVISVRTTGDTSARATVEACDGHIVIRPATSLLQGEDSSETLTVSGVLDDDQAVAANKLFSLCSRQPLQPRPHVVRQDVSESAILQLQSENEFVPLPTGWVFDGDKFIDYYGTSRVTRPDIEDMIVDYMRAKNAEVDEFNQFIAEFGQFLL